MCDVIGSFHRNRLIISSTTVICCNKRPLSGLWGICFSNKTWMYLFIIWRCSSDDQENLEGFLKQLSTDGHRYHFRTLQDSEAENFLYVHQTREQQILMRKYGNEICLLDATYKTSRYGLPLFLIAVPTNTSYQVLGHFIISKETTHSIREAITKLAEWNPEWRPSYWMTDCCVAEINAVEAVFPGKTHND